MKLISGVEDIKRRLKAIPESVRGGIKPAIEKSADEMIAKAKMYAPSDKGNLKKSIRKEAGSNELQVIVKAGGPLTTVDATKTANSVLRKLGKALGFKIKLAKYDYSIGIEFGTQEMPAQPFFWTSYRSTKPRNIRRIKTQSTKQIKKAWSNGK